MRFPIDDLINRNIHFFLSYPVYNNSSICAVIACIRIFGWLLVLSVAAIVLSTFVLEFFRPIGNLDQLDVPIPFWAFLLLFALMFGVTSSVIGRFVYLIRSDIIFHIIFLLVILNIVGVIVHSLGFHVYSWVYFVTSLVYVVLVAFAGTRFIRLGFGILVLYLFHNLIFGSDITLLLSNVMVYRAARRRHRFRRKFFHGFVPSIAPAQLLITLFYRQFGDTVFVRDYNGFAGSLIYVGLSCLVFLIFSAFYHKFVYVALSPWSLKQFVFSVSGSWLTSGFIYAIGMFFVLVNLPYLPIGVTELYRLISRLGQQYDYQSYVLFVCYGSAIYAISRSWVAIMRWVAFQIVRRDYIIDLDYKAVRPIVYGFRPFPLFWKFPRLWFRELFESSKKPFRRSIPPAQPEDAVYYYGGPNPNMVIFNPYTGSVIFLLVRDLIHENYRIYYKLYKFVKRKFPIQLFSVYEKRWSRRWIVHTHRRLRARILRSPAPYYYYTRQDLKSDYVLNRLLVFEDATKDNSDEPVATDAEDEEKSFFDSYLWESVWLKGFGRSMPSHIPVNLTPGNFLNPVLRARRSNSGIFPRQMREDYQDLLMFRRRYLIRQLLNINQSIGLIPSEILRTQIPPTSNFKYLDYIGGVGLKNFVLKNLNYSDISLISYAGFDVGHCLLDTIRKLQTQYFQDAQQFIPGWSSFQRKWYLGRPLRFFLPCSRNRIISYSVLAQLVSRKVGFTLFRKYFALRMFRVKFLEAHNLCKLERGFAQVIHRSRLSSVALLLPQLGRFGFDGRDLRDNPPNGEFLNYLDCPTPLNSIQANFERILLNFPPYNYVIEQPREFFGIFESRDERLSRSQQGLLGRFCFVNSRILLDNERKSKVNRFYVDLDTWTSRFGGFEYVKLNCFDLLGQYMCCPQHFRVGAMVYERFRSIVFLVTHCLSLVRAGGVELAGTQFHKLGLLTYNLDESIVYSNPQYLGRVRRLYRKLPFTGFMYSTLLNTVPELASDRRPVLQNFSVLGSDIPFPYICSTTNNVYTNSVFAQSFYAQFFSGSYSHSFSNFFLASSLASMRFKIPGFYPAFDRWFSNSLFQDFVLGPGVSNHLSFNYVGGLVHKLFNMFAWQLLTIRSSNIYWELRWRFEFQVFGTFPLESWLRFVSHGNISPVLYYRTIRNFDLPTSRVLFFVGKYAAMGSIVEIGSKSRRWTYNWVVKVARPSGAVKRRFEYYSAKGHPRLRESFLDRVGVHSSGRNLVSAELGSSFPMFWVYLTRPLVNQFPRSRSWAFSPRFLRIAMFMWVRVYSYQCSYTS